MKPKLKDIDTKIYSLLHRQTRKNLAMKHYRTGKRKSHHRIRRDLEQRLMRQTGLGRQAVHESIRRIRDWLLGNEI